MQLQQSLRFWASSELGVIEKHGLSFIHVLKVNSELVLR